MEPELRALFEATALNIADFPTRGSTFLDIAPFLAERSALKRAIDVMEEVLLNAQIDAVVAIEARGFVIGAPLADRLGLKLILVRKEAKLPGAVDSYPYQSEYSTGILQVTSSVVSNSLRCAVVDDFLATGGTAEATASYLATKGAIVAALAFLVEFSPLAGRTRLQRAFPGAIMCSVFIYSSEGLGSDFTKIVLDR